MPELKDVIESVEKEVKAVGEGFAAVKKLNDSMQVDLKSVRELAEKAGKDVTANTQVAADVKALAEGVAAKHDAIEKQVKEIQEKALKAANDRLDGIEKKLNRSRLMGGTALGGDPDAEFKAAQDFYRATLGSRGKLDDKTDLSEDKINLEEFKAYNGAFPKYIRRHLDPLEADERKAMQTGLDPSGGYFVSPTMMARILTIYRETSPMRALASIENVSSDKAIFPIDDDEAEVGWVGENEDRDETDTPDAGTQAIDVHEVFAMPRVTQRLLEDVDFDVESYLGGKVGEKIGRTEATSFVAGNGVKKPKGFLSYSNGTTRGYIEQIASGIAADFTLDSFIRTQSALKDFYAAGAVWAMRRATVGLVMLKKDGKGGYLWQPNVQLGKPAVLLGHEVHNFADMPAMEADALAVAFGNFRICYTIVDRRGLVTLRDPYTKKGSVKFYTTKRVGGDVTNFEAIKIMKIAAS
jgi:HK97 family phage major capsid protein